MKKYISLLITLFLVTSLAVAKEQKAEVSAEQKQLNYGYALLYQAFDSMQKLNLALTLKKETQEIHNTVKNLTEITENFKNKLDELKKDYPNLNFDDTGRPVVLEKKGKAQGKERLSEYMPITGKTGNEYERSLLLFLATVLNELKFISQEMGNMEKNEGLKKFLKEINSSMIRLEDRMLKILNEKYFKHNFYKPQTQDKK
jgi:uncharacterized protein (DUF2164 family)